MSDSIKGYIHSIQSLGAIDGPGLRFVVFMQGCNLRCGCCHNPDTWDMQGGTEITPSELLARAIRYRNYFGENGGVTVSGGEPLLQAEFVTEFFELCHINGINTCLDTSGDILSSKVKKLLAVTDRVLLDIKYPTDELYLKYVGCSIDAPLLFLSYLNSQKIPVTLRQVIIPTLNDNETNIDFLNSIIKENGCIDKAELLPFKKLCDMKYQKMGIPFRFAEYKEPRQEHIEALQARLIIK